MCNVDLNCGDSEQGASVPDTAVHLQWSNARFQTKDASHRTEGGPNQPSGLGNGSLISIFLLKIDDIFADLFQNVATFC